MTAEYLHESQDKLISVERGMSNEKVIEILAANGIVKDPLPIRIYMKMAPTRVLFKAGDYKFSSPTSSIRVLKKLEEGGAEHEKLTIIEGWTRFDIARAMLRYPSLGITSEKEAIQLMSRVELIKDLDPDATSLEGYLFPDTYFIQADTSKEELIKQMTDRFKEIWAKNLDRKAIHSGLSTRQIVTIASIIETEAKLSNERPVVASVIFNRLRKGMRLSVDSTIVYASKLAGKWRDDGKIYMSDIKLDSPYNTRKYPGLPPGPVGSPSLNSLISALAPAHTDYLYYVRDPDKNDGTHDFYDNVADFERGVAKLREWEKQQKKLGKR